MVAVPVDSQRITNNPKGFPILAGYFLYTGNRLYISKTIKEDAIIGPNQLNTLPPILLFPGEYYMTTRREFLKMSVAGAAALFSANHSNFMIDAFAFSQSSHLNKFIQPLRRPGADIPIAAPDKLNPGWWQPGVTHYTLDVNQYVDQLHPDLPNPTRLMGFGQGGNFKHLDGIIAAKRNEPVQITFRNNLPVHHILPIDRTIMGAMDGDDRVDIHLHGGHVP